MAELQRDGRRGFAREAQRENTGMKNEFGIFNVEYQGWNWNDFVERKGSLANESD